MNLFSINYLHAGAPKYWYSISPEDGPRFESLAAHHFSGAASTCPEFLRHKRYLLSPAILRKGGIKFKTQVQRPGDTIITFPGSYHFGFNTGFNVAESTNFAVSEWVPHGDNAEVCLCHPDSVRIDMDRFKTLLVKYEQHCRDTKQRISYSEWARREAQTRGREESVPTETMKKKKTYGKPDFGDNDNLDSGNDEAPSYPFFRRVNESIIVQVTGPSNSRKSRRGSRARLRKNEAQGEGVTTCRIALKALPKRFVPKCKVLCFQPCIDEDEDGNAVTGKRCFEATITEVIENRARIHFRGVTKKNDVWIRLDSGDIFLDGGIHFKTEDAAGNKVARARKKIKNDDSMDGSSRELYEKAGYNHTIPICAKLSSEEREVIEGFSSLAEQPISWLREEVKEMPASPHDDRASSTAALPSIAQQQQGSVPLKKVYPSLQRLGPEQPKSLGTNSSSPKTINPPQNVVRVASVALLADSPPQLVQTPVNSSVPARSSGSVPFLIRQQGSGQSVSIHVQSLVQASNAPIPHATLRLVTCEPGVPVTCCVREQPGQQDHVPYVPPQSAGGVSFPAMNGSTTVVYINNSDWSSCK